MLPPVSLPSAATHWLAATADAEPPLLPPGTRSGSQGLKVGCSAEQRRSDGQTDGQADVGHGPNRRHPNVLPSQQSGTLWQSKYSQLQRVSAHLVARVFAAAAHAKLVHVCLSQQHRPRCPQPRDSGGVISGHIALQLLAARRGGQPLGAQVVLGHRQMGCTRAGGEQC